MSIERFIEADTLIRGLMFRTRNPRGSTDNQRWDERGSRWLPYSPDLNPIEMIWSRVESLLRSIAARTVNAWHHALGVAMAAITPTDIQGCFRHCGYTTNEGAPL